VVLQSLHWDQFGSLKDLRLRWAIRLLESWQKVLGNTGRHIR